MNLKTVGIAGLVSGIVLFILGGVFYAGLLSDFFASNATVSGMRDEPLMAGIILGELLGAFIMATIYEKWSQGDYNLQNGLVFGATFGLLLGGSMGLVLFSANGIMSSTAWMVDLAISLLRFSIAGLVIALIFGKLNKPANP